MPPASKVVVRLTDEQRDALEQLLRTGSCSAAMRRRAEVLLLTDAGGPDALPDEEVAEQLGTSRMTVQRVRHQFAAEGLDATLHRKKPTGRQYRKLDGAQDAQLVAIACSKAPEGQARWTMELLAERLVELKVVDAISPATICRTLQKMNSSRGSSGSGSSRRRRAGRSWRPWKR